MMVNVMDDNNNEPWMKRGELEKLRRKSEFRKDFRLVLYTFVTVATVFGATSALKTSLSKQYFQYDGYVLRYDETQAELCFIAATNHISEVRKALGYVECKEVRERKERLVHEEFDKLLEK